MRRTERQQANHGWSFVLNDSPTQPASATARLSSLTPAAQRLAQAGAEALRQQRPDVAERDLRTALVQAPAHPEVERLLALALRAQGKNAEALELLRQAAQRWPADVLVQNGLGTALDACGEREAAIAAFRCACALAPQAAPLWANLGKTLCDYGLFEEAVPVLERVVAMTDHAASKIRLAHALRALGRIDDAERLLRTMLEHDPTDSQVWLALAGLKTRPLSAHDIAAVEVLLQRQNLKPGERISLQFTLAKAYDDHGRYADAFAQYTQGNVGIRQMHPWQAAYFSRFVDDVIRIFAQPTASAPGGLGDEVIFIVSLPRSGSSLTEQILASHPLIDGGGELDATTTVIEAESTRRQKPFPLWVPDATPADWQRMGRHYLELTKRWQRPGMRFTDKLPGNWSRVGLIMAMLPGARIIDCRRDPVESCFSCFRNLFSQANQPFSYDLGDIAAYWRDYDRASRHWQELYPTRYRVQQYETLVAEPEPQIQQLLDFCGVPFDPACLRHHENTRSVRTASAAQIREPIRRDTARAHKYGALLDPLRVALGLPPFAA